MIHPKLLSVSIKVQLNHFSSGKDHSLFSFFLAQIYVKFVSRKAFGVSETLLKSVSDWLLDLMLIPV